MGNPEGTRDNVLVENVEQENSTPDSPTDAKENVLTGKELTKAASKAFGYIQRSIELLGKESTRLAGARDYSNTLHWTQAMKFLKEQGYIYTKTGHGTSVAEQYKNLEGLAKAFQEQFPLENFPLPRLSKTHMEKTEPKSYYEDPTGFPPGKPYLQYDFNAFSVPPQYGRYYPDYSANYMQRAAYPVSPAPVMANQYIYGSSYVARAQPAASPTGLGNLANHIPSSTGLGMSTQMAPTHSTMAYAQASIVVPQPTQVQHVEHSALQPIQSSLPSLRESPPHDGNQQDAQLNRRTSMEMHKLNPLESKDRLAGIPALPPLANLTTAIEEERRASNPDVPRIPIPLSAGATTVDPEESLLKLRQKAADALLLQSFSETVEKINKRPLSPSQGDAIHSSSSSEDVASTPEKRARVDTSTSIAV